MTRTYRRQSSVLCLGIVLLLGGTPMYAHADDKSSNRKPTPCLLVNSIERDEAASERTVVFFMRGKQHQIYRNDLLAACPFMKRGETELVYYYHTQSVKLQRLCDYDAIAVFRREDTPCHLGSFLPITADEAADLLGKPRPGTETAGEPAQKAADGSANANKGEAAEAKK
ncbi:MAG TPA: hypothetical protein VMU03_10465 [Gammaproteobacteria bacterium]|nr:hypothetical protein [Gammaproteobacteria bacterium]